MHCFRQKQVLGSEVVSSLLTYVECGKNGANSRQGKTHGHTVTLACALLQAPILVLDTHDRACACACQRFVVPDHSANSIIRRTQRERERERERELRHTPHPDRDRARACEQERSVCVC